MSKKPILFLLFLCFGLYTTGIDRLLFEHNEQTALYCEKDTDEKDGDEKDKSEELDKLARDFFYNETTYSSALSSFKGGLMAHNASFIVSHLLEIISPPPEA